MSRYKPKKYGVVDDIVVALLMAMFYIPYWIIKALFDRGNE